MRIDFCWLILIITWVLAADLSPVFAVNKETQTQIQTDHSGYTRCQFNPPSAGCPLAGVCSSNCKSCLKGFALIKSACLPNNTCDCHGWKVASAPSNAHGRRLAALHQVLSHPWMIYGSFAPEHDSRLKQFSAIKMALRVIEKRLSEEEIGGLKGLSKMVDTDKGGTIKFEELKDGSQQLGSEHMESEIKDLMAAADIDNSGKIDYGKFLAVTVHLNMLENEENLVSAFSFFDKDGNGYVTINELQQGCKELGLIELHQDENDQRN